MTKQAFFYSIDVLETTIYDRLLFLSLKTRNHGFRGNGHGGHRWYYRDFKAENGSAVW